MDQVTSLDLVGFDYDGTIANTFKPSPRGIGIEACYVMALRDMFGSTTLLDDIGGLKNQASAQVIAAVLALDPSLGEKGCRYYVRHRDELSALVPKGKGTNCGSASLVLQSRVGKELEDDKRNGSHCTRGGLERPYSSPGFRQRARELT